MKRELSRPQEEVLSCVAGERSLRGIPGQSLKSVVAQGLVAPHNPPVLTQEGRKALETGQGKPTKRVGGLMWCRVADLEMEPGRKSPVWGAYGPRGVHLLTRGRREWWLRIAGMENRESIMISVWGAWAALSSASEWIARAQAPVWEQVRH